MAVTGTAGAERARTLLFGLPDRFAAQTQMDMFTFVQLADWILENVSCNSTADEDISVEESLFVFLDIVANGTSFRDTAYGWDHDIKLTQNIFLNILNALMVLHNSEEISPSCPPFNMTKGKWKILNAWRGGKRRKSDAPVRVGDDCGDDGLDIDRDQIIQAITALNNFIHERREQ